MTDTEKRHWVFRAHVLDRAGALTSIASAFSNEGISIDTVVGHGLEAHAGVDGSVVMTFWCDAREKDIMVRKIRRLSKVTGLEEHPYESQSLRKSAIVTANRRLAPHDVDVVSTHATGTVSGDVQECQALRRVFGQSTKTYFNNTKSFIGHAMGAAGALELAGNLPAFNDRVCHATINLEHVDPQCAMPGLVAQQPREMDRVDYILNNSFGMLGINSVVIVGRVSC